MSESWWQDSCRSPDGHVLAQAQARQQQLTKPAGSLGRLEQTAVTLAALQGRERPQVERLWIAIFAGDHGVVAEGVSAFPQAVTGQMLGNFVGGGAAISVLAREWNATLEVLDLGTAAALEPLAGVRQLRIGAGTANFLHGPAMTGAQLALALAAGRDSLARAREAGVELYLGGELGIGNTTAASALACVLLACPAQELVGPRPGPGGGGGGPRARAGRPGGGAGGCGPPRGGLKTPPRGGPLPGLRPAGRAGPG